MVHPLSVAHILADMQMDMVCLQTALLHDVVEDTGAAVEDIRKNFGEEVARCVDGVTKLSKLNFYSREQRQAESVRKMLLAMVDDIRVIIVKLADRLHNMRTLDPAAGEAGAHRAGDDRIYAPIAHRLGMGKIRGELEDLAFSYLEPEAYRDVADADRIQARRPTSSFCEEIQRTVETQAARRRHSRRASRPGQARLLGLPEAQAAEDRHRPGVRSARPCASSPIR